MKYLLVAATIVVLSLLACGGPGTSTSEIDPQSTSIDIPESTEPPPSSAPPTPKTPENTLVETPGYTGVIISESGAAVFGYLFRGDSTEFWEPSIDDVSSAEACIREFLVSGQDDPRFDAYQQESMTFILKNLEEYRRQYVGIAVDGEKRIWCNAFFSESSFPNWERVPVEVEDGGRHYWQIEYDLLKDECMNLNIHGVS